MHFYYKNFPTLIIIMGLTIYQFPELFRVDIMKIRGENN